jgi:hypothetical protein
MTPDQFELWLYLMSVGIVGCVAVAFLAVVVLKRIASYEAGVREVDPDE